MRRTVGALPRILLVILVLGMAGGAGILFCRFLDRVGEAGPPEIPEDAVLNGLNWNQSAPNMYECFTFDLVRSKNGLLLSGWYIEPEGDQKIEGREMPLAAEQEQSIAQCLRDGSHRAYPENTAKTEVYDETTSRLCVSWRLSNGDLLSVKYAGGGETELQTLLKNLLK